jgi:hypothetical protein
MTSRVLSTPKFFDREMEPYAMDMSSSIISSWARISQNKAGYAVLRSRIGVRVQAAQLAPQRLHKPSSAGCTLDQKLSKRSW